MLMTLVESVRRRLRRRRVERELDEEMQVHVGMATRAHMDEGMSPAQARRVALRDLGGVTQTQEAVRDVQRVWPDVVHQDVRHAARRW